MSTFVVILAYISIVYIIASIYYTIRTKNIGTPFKDAVMKHPELISIKLEQVSIRGNIFREGVILAILLMILIRPF